MGGGVVVRVGTVAVTVVIVAVAVVEVVVVIVVMAAGRGRPRGSRGAPVVGHGVKRRRGRMLQQVVIVGPFFVLLLLLCWRRYACGQLADGPQPCVGAVILVVGVWRRGVFAVWQEYVQSQQRCGVQ